LQILDLLSAKVDVVVVPDFPTPSAFIFLWQRNCFLSLLLHSIGVWNLQVCNRGCLCAPLNLLPLVKTLISCHSACTAVSAS
jgi:hypothetical protein